MKLTYRNAAIADIASIMKIESACFHSSVCENENVFLERISTFPDGFRIMEYNGQAIGYISSEKWHKSKGFTKDQFTLGHSIQERHQSNGTEIYISSMGILPQYRSQGMGGTMFKEFIKHVKGRMEEIESVILIVSENWVNARRIYRNSGFAEIGILEGFFGYEGDNARKEAAIVMRKKL